ncbi:uncharacterized protein LOC128768060 [Synchiropus splendidus]|uniref:uncharacterized protein LOC128768060 n=1 Tax=Synchiropus splendidus TaxID=270530 RepID=UPI00237E90FD|nr:uncharacterized protein LOC128768060 [Synchiropus splendidus]
MLPRRRRQVLVLQTILLCCAGAAGDTFLFAQEGAEVTLSCDSRAPDQASCEGTTWLGEKDRGTETLAEHKTVKVDVDRLSLAPDCSLVIKKMGAGDARHYTCRQFDGPRPYTDADTFLSMVSLTRSMTQGDMTLTCKVIRPGFCPEKVQWLYKGQTITKDHPQLKTSSTTCGDAAVQFPLTSFLESHLLTCEVSHRDTVERFPFQAAVSTGATTTTASTSATPVDDSGHWWLYGVAAAAALTLLVLVVVLVRWRRLKGRRAQVQKKLTSDLSASPADPESGHDTENPGEELCYSSVTYNKKTHSNKVKGHEDDEVTYSTVKSKASPSDKCDLYASISKN